MLEKIIAATPYGNEIFAVLLTIILSKWIKYQFRTLLTDKYADLKEEKYD